MYEIHTVPKTIPVDHFMTDAATTQVCFTNHRVTIVQCVNTAHNDLHLQTHGDILRGLLQAVVTSAKQANLLFKSQTQLQAPRLMAAWLTFNALQLHRRSGSWFLASSCLQLHTEVQLSAADSLHTSSCQSAAVFTHL